MSGNARMSDLRVNAGIVTCTLKNQQQGFNAATKKAMIWIDFYLKM